MSPQLLTPDLVGTREKFLIYGEPGTGKTRAALTAPGPIYFLAIGGPNEVKTYFSPSFRQAFPDKKVYLDVAEESIDERGQFDEAVGFDRACDLLDDALEADRKGDLNFETIVIDNATILSEFQMNKVFEISQIDAKDKTKTALRKLRDHGIYTPADYDWGGAQSLMGKFVSWLFKLDKHIVFVAHEHQDTTTDRASHTQIIQSVKPLFIGKQRNQIANLFDNVWRMTMNGQFFEARTVATDRPFSVIAKTRVGGVLDRDFRDVDLEWAIQQLQDAAHGR